MKVHGRAVLALALAGWMTKPALAQHLVTPGEAHGQVQHATVAAGQNLETVQSFLSEHGADPKLALALDTRQLADVAGEIRTQQQQQQKGASTGVYMLAGAGILLLLLLIIGLAVGSTE